MLIIILISPSLITMYSVYPYIFYKFGWLVNVYPSFVPHFSPFPLLPSSLTICISSWEEQLTFMINIEVTKQLLQLDKLPNLWGLKYTKMTKWREEAASLVNHFRISTPIWTSRAFIFVIIISGAKSVFTIMNTSNSFVHVCVDNQHTWWYDWKVNISVYDYNRCWV